MTAKLQNLSADLFAATVRRATGQYRGKYSCSSKCDSLSLPARTAPFLLSLSWDGDWHRTGGYLLLEAVMTVVMRG